MITQNDRFSFTHSTLMSPYLNVYYTDNTNIINYKFIT